MWWDLHRLQVGADSCPLLQVGAGVLWEGPHRGGCKSFVETDPLSPASLPTGSSSLTYRVVLGKQVLSEDEAGSLAVSVDKFIVHEKWNSFLIM